MSQKESTIWAEKAFKELGMRVDHTGFENSFWSLPVGSNGAEVVVNGGEGVLPEEGYDANVVVCSEEGVLECVDTICAEEYPKEGDFLEAIKSSVRSHANRLKKRCPVV